jgi:NAD+ synthetase
MNDAMIVANIRKSLKNYIKQNKLESLVIGESGGIDSALCTALAEPVCKELRIKLIGRSLPILTNKRDEIVRAKAIGENFCDDFKEDPLGCIYGNTVYVCLINGVGDPESQKEKIRRGNVKARVRMIYLYDLAQKEKGLVLSTDNLTEYYLGFWTLCGDVGDYGMIQQLWKTEVYSISDYIAKELYKNNEVEKSIALVEAIKATPTDGLGITNSDLDQIGASSYKEVDDILQNYIIIGNKTYENHPVIKRYKASHFKRNWPIVIKREELFKGVKS